MQNASGFLAEAMERHRRQIAEQEIERFGRVLTSEERSELARREDELERNKRELQKQEVRLRRYQKRVATIPSRFLSVASDGVEIYAKRAFELLRDGKHDAVVYGENGTGKTFLGWALIHEQWRQGREAMYTTCFRMLSAIKRSYGTSDDERRRVLGLYYSVPFLVIDELDKTHGSQDDFVSLFDIINERWNWERATVVITNSPQDELVQTVGKAVFSRLGKGGHVITLAGGDKRAPKEGA